MAAAPQRPAGRRPPPAPTDTPPELPPSLPPRPGGLGRSAPPPPTPAQRDESDEEYCEPNAGPDDVYDDCNQETDSLPAAPEEVYDDICNQPPPLPPSHHNLPPIPQPANSEPEETYDDFEEQPPPPPQPTLPQRPPPAPPQAPEETYDDISNAGPIVQHLPKKLVRDLPPPPSPVTKTSQPKEEVFDDVYEDPDTCEVPTDSGSDEFEEEDSHSDNPENVYEVSGESQGGQVSSPAPPPPLPGRSAPDARPAKAAKPAGTSKPAAGGFAIDSSQILNLKNNLRKISIDNGNTPPPTTHVTKEYSECTGSVSSFIGKFQQKAAVGKPALPVRSNSRPEISFKPKDVVNRSLSVGGAGTVNSTTTSRNGSIAGSSNNINSCSSTVDLDSLPLPPRPAVLTVAASSPTSPAVSGGTLSPSSSPAVPNSNCVGASAANCRRLHLQNVPLPPLPSPTPPPPKPAKLQEPPESECSDEIYDDACSGEILHSYEWFHGDIHRQDSEAKIKAFGKDGTFLVRTSKNDPKFPYTLVVYHEGRINNLRIRERTDGKYALGDEKADELAFTDVMAMIAHHKKNHVVLLGKQHAQVVLQQTPSKR